MEIIVRPNRDVVTLINVFLVEPGNQEKLIEVLKEGTEALFSKQPGYVSTSFHKSKDGRRVVNYGQWATDYRSKPEFGAYLKRVIVVCDVATCIARDASARWRMSSHPLPQGAHKSP